MLAEHKIVPTLNAKITDQLIDNMNDYCALHWRDYIIDGRIYIDEEGELEHAYERVFGADLPDNLYNLLDDPELTKCFEDMRTTIEEEAQDHQSAYRYYAGTMAEQLRERGLSIRDFL